MKFTRVSLFLAVLGWTTVAYGQTVITQPGGKLVWDQETSATDTVKPDAYAFQIVRDSQPPVATTAECTAPASGTTWVCKALLPDLPNGTYVFKVIASAAVDGTNHVSQPSEGITLAYQTITFIIAVPKNLRIEQPGG